MKISFDLDDTIIPGSKVFETERQTLFQKLLGVERIRKGTIELFKELKKQDHKVGIYTTSYRSCTKIKLLFLLNGFLLDFIINQKRHLLKVNNGNIHCSKYPLAFNIDLHIDDSRGVEIEGERYGFRTIIIDEQQPEWNNIILTQLKLL